MARNLIESHKSVMYSVWSVEVWGDERGFEGIEEILWLGSHSAVAAKGSEHTLEVVGDDLSRIAVFAHTTAGASNEWFRKLAKLGEEIGLHYEMARRAPSGLMEALLYGSNLQHDRTFHVLCDLIDAAGELTAVVAPTCLAESNERLIRLTEAYWNLGELYELNDGWYLCTMEELWETRNEWAGTTKEESQILRALLHKRRREADGGGPPSVGLWTAVNAMTTWHT